MKRVFAYQPPEEEIYRVKSFLSQMDAGYKISWTSDHSRWQIEAENIDAEGIVINLEFKPFLRCCKHDSFMEINEHDMIICPVCAREEELERSNGEKFRERLSKCCSAGPENVIFYEGYPYQLCPPKEQGKLVMMTYEEISWISGMIAEIPCYLRDKLREAM